MQSLIVPGGGTLNLTLYDSKLFVNDFSWTIFVGEGVK